MRVGSGDVSLKRLLLLLSSRWFGCEIETGQTYANVTVNVEGAQRRTAGTLWAVSVTLTHELYETVHVESLYPDARRCFIRFGELS